jgi:alkanesulfonate monooxygenase SsuD/methylene tetrahydromethanopterin reductase-like flavin-dependent oxidoreductase (luciferase family)
MRVGTYHTFQCPPWTEPHEVFHREIERAVLAEELGYDSVWVPEQHFFDYCLCGDALQMASFIAAQTSRVRIGTAIVNLTFTHPLRFAERVAMLDILSGGRVDVGVGRGYQWPQYPVMQVDMETTRERFDESLDIVLSAWQPHEFEHRGAYYDIPPARLWPVPERRPEDVLLHAASSPTSVDNAITRGLPAIFSSFIPIESEAEAFAEYLAKVEAAGGDIATTRQRATVMRYIFVAETRREARALAREPFDWHFARVNALTIPPDGQLPRSYVMSDRGGRADAMPDLTYDEWNDSILVFDDPDGCYERLRLLKDSGVENLVVLMGVGGMAHEHVERSMRLFADEVLPRLR